MDSPETTLVVHYRGETFVVSADDPRLPFFELLLFGPLQAARAQKARAEIPPQWARYWWSLPSAHKRVLEAATKGPLTNADIERLTPASGETVRTLNLLLAVRAKEMGISAPLVTRGRARAGRRYEITEEARRQVLAILELDGR